MDDIIRDISKLFIRNEKYDITIKKDLTKSSEKLKCNKGKIGPGGSNTNKNGLLYEKLTELSTEYDVILTDKNSKKIKFKLDKEITFIETKQSRLFKCMDKSVNKGIAKAHGCKNPDGCYINEITKTIFILENKFQQVCGSVCEKIQTPDFKIWQYKRTFPDYKIIYIYCLSDWFKDNCKAELEYLEYKKIPVFWGNCKNYKQDITNFIISYKQGPLL